MIRILLGIIAALVLVAGVQTWRLDRSDKALASAREQIARWRDFADLSTKAADEAAEACSARVAEARRSTQRIETIVERPVDLDSQGCPVRSLVRADVLRDALQPAPAKP